jgi:hypothetical protein
MDGFYATEVAAVSQTQTRVMRLLFGEVLTPPSGSQSFFLSRGLPQKDGKRSDQMDETQEPRIGHADRQGA